MRLDIRGILLRLGLAAVAAATGAGCGRPSPSGGTTEPGALRVVASTTVLADLVRQVGGVKVTVDSLVPKGGEVHTFDPSPGDAKRLGEADLIVMNGLGLDEWLGDLARDAGVTAPIVELGEDLDGVTYLGCEETGEQVNPHLWLNVAHARKYVARIADALAAADPDSASMYAAGAAAYDESLVGLDATVREQIATIPEANRKLVSFHEGFPYFADAYGLEIVGVVVDAPGQDPSAGEIAALVDAIRAAGVRAIFSEAQFNDDLVRTIADETGARVVSDLYNDSVGEPPADTYVGLMRWNVERIVEALGQG